MSKVELKVDVINQLILYRNSTFKDKFAFLDEDIQNAQRAGAKNVYVTMEGKKIVIENDGKILEDPQFLFTMAESGWDKEVKENENPFGLGFFSNINVSNLIEIQSGYTFIIFDVDKVIQTRDTSAIDIHDLPEPLEGFRLTLNNIDTNMFSLYKVREKVETLGKYVQELDIWFNGTKMTRDDLTEGDGDARNRKINNELFTGYFRLADTFMPELKIYYRGRFVKSITLPGMVGDIHITDKTVNLTAPDRRDIINDEKYDIFLKKIKSEARDYCIELFLSGDQKRVDDLGGIMDNYMTPEDLMGKVNFVVLKGKEDSELIKEIIRIKKEHYLNGFTEIENKLIRLRKYEQIARQEPESGPEEFQVEYEVGTPVSEGKYYGGGGYGGYSSPVVSDSEKSVIPPNQLPKDRIIFWVETRNLDDYEKKIEFIRRYDLPLVISRNKLEDRLLKHLGEANKFVHISELDGKLKIVSHIVNASPINTKEKRAEMLLDYVSRLAGFDSNVFVIGDLKLKRVIDLEEYGIQETVEVNDVAVIADKDKVYMDRNYIRDKYSRQDLSTKFSVQDYKFILGNLRLLCQEMILLKHDMTETQLFENIVEALGK